MPGLNQLKKFNKDILSLGDEPNLRASRGEQPVRVPIPRSIEDRDDTEDFVLGMPENEAPVVDTQVDDDLSDIIGGGKTSTPNTSESTPSFETPDLSNLLNLGNDTQDSSGGDMPDLSMFMEPVGEPEEEIIEEEPEPEEISVADMGLDALLSGAGFDGSEGTDNSATNKTYGSDEYYDFDELDNLDLQEKPEPKQLEPEQTDVPNLEGFSDLEKALLFPETQNQEPEEAAEDIDVLEDLEEIPEEESFGTDDISGLDDISAGVEDAFSMDDVPGLDDISGGEEVSLGDEIPTAEVPAGEETFGLDDIPGLDDLSAGGADAFSTDDVPGLDDISGGEDAFSMDDIPGLDDISSGEEVSLGDEIPTAEVPSGEENFGLDDIPGLDDISAGEDAFSTDDIPGLDDISGGEEVSLGDEIPTAEVPSGEESFGLDDIPGLDDISAGADAFSTDDIPGLDDISAGEEVSLGDEISTAEVPSDEESFGLDDIPGLDDISAGADAFGTDDIPGLDDISTGTDAFSTDDIPGLDDISTGEEVSLGDEIPTAEVPAGEESFGLDDIPGLDDISASADAFSTDDISGLDDISSGADAFSTDGIPGLDDSSDPFAAASPEGLFDAADMELPDMGDSSEISADSSEPDSDFNTDNLFTSEIPDYDDDSSQSEDDSNNLETLEVFDTSGMDGDIDFGITDTDTALSGGGDFELGNADDFVMEGSDFEIPGFSDVDAIEEKKSAPILTGKKGRGRGKNDNLDSPDFSGGLEGEKLPPNTLSDEQYKQFLKNFSEYPLNVRLAFEDFIVQDEFTDDAEFEVIEKILNKAPARQVASTLEKMLDISIPVPRDFEHRTAEEYEAYKKSIQYQLRNKIIPAMIVGIVMIFVGWGLFNFGKYCIYIPSKAVSLYKQGYALIQSDEYPQSEQKFEEAVSYKLNKKWFFNYARAYRQHKQYQRSADMYTKILRNFKQDKQAGLEFADMMLNDLSNYERAEEILKREVLDYHINDADGILLLGDTYLEWGTEKEPEKLDLAKQQYSMLSQIYGANDLYNSRLMRYYVRTDDLVQVLNYKAIFENREKSLSAQDCTEMSGYLLDKLYGPLSPSEEPLRTKIEGIKPLLLRAIQLDPNNAVGLYNLGKYYVNTNEIYYVETTLKDSIAKFKNAEVLKKRDIYKYIDAHRLLGENYIKTGDTMKAQEQYTDGITLYTTERDNSGFEGNLDIGKMYEDLADINYFVSGDYDLAKENYQHSIELGNDSPTIRYRIGYVNYRNKNYQEALGSFMKAGEANRKEDNLLLAMANTLSLRDDDYSAEGYYEQLIARLDDEIAEKQVVFPQTSVRDYDIVDTYLKASNNYGVTLHRLAKRTGNSAKNAQAIVQFQQSLRAWDALTRNQETLVRLEGSNLAQENIKYITQMYSNYEPSIYIDIPRTLTDGEGL